MSTTGRGSTAPSATADREIVISRVIGAPRELVFEAFTEVRHLSRWWGPEGFTTTTRAFEKYHAIEGGEQTLANLAAYIAEIVQTGAED